VISVSFNSGHTGYRILSILQTSTFSWSSPPLHQICFCCALLAVLRELGQADLSPLLKYLVPTQTSVSVQSQATSNLRRNTYLHIPRIELREIRLDEFRQLVVQDLVALRREMKTVPVPRQSPPSSHTRLCKTHGRKALSFSSLHPPAASVIALCISITVTPSASATSTQAFAYSFVTAFRWTGCIGP
jgi:hypothetical protein